MTRQKARHILLGYIVPILGVLLLVGFFFLARAAMTPIDSATDTQVWDVAVAHGYSPYYLTDEYKEEYPNMGFVQNVTFTKDDLRFEFFVFESLQKTLNASSTIASEIESIKREYNNNCIATEESRANFYISTVKAGGKYYYLMRIDNTVFYAYGDEEYASEIRSIAKDLGYVGDV